jgi:hypothetical protein
LLAASVAAVLQEKMQNEYIIITHTTLRTPMWEVRKILQKSLPADIYGKIILLMDRKQ